MVLERSLGHVSHGRPGDLFNVRDRQGVPELDPAATVFGPDAWAVWSGTSFAAPQIAGALARLYEDGYPLRKALQTLLAAGLPVPEYGQALKILPGI